MDDRKITPSEVFYSEGWLTDIMSEMPDHKQPCRTAIEALAESWASMDGKLQEFYRGKEDHEYELKVGHYTGYIAEAESMIERLQRRGYQVTPL